MNPSPIMIEAILQTAMEGIATFDAQGRLLLANHAFARCNGYDSTAELRGEPWFRFFAETEKERLNTVIASTLQSHPRWQGETRGLRYDGSSYPLALSLSAPQGAGEDGWICAIRDLSSEIAQKRASSLLQAAIESTADGLLVVNPEGRIVLSNKKFQNLFRLSDEVLSTGDDDRALANVVDQLKDPQQFLNQVYELYAKPNVESFDVLEFRDGRIYERYSIPQLLDGVPVGRVWSFRDVTEERQIECDRAGLLLKESRSRAQAEKAELRAGYLAEVSSVLENSLDLKSTVATVARLAIPRLADMCIVDIHDESNAFNRMAVAHLDPEIEKRLEAGLLGRIMGKNELTSGTFKVMKSGRTELCSVASIETALAVVQGDQDRLKCLEQAGIKSCLFVPLRARGKTLGALTLARCSDKCYTIDDLVLVEDVAQRFAMAIANAQLYTEAQEAVRARQEFISIASHELRTPLTSLQGFIQLLARTVKKSGVKALSEAKGAELITRAEEQCQRIVKFLANLLDVSHISTRGLKLDLENLDLTEVSRETVARFLQSLQDSERCEIRVEAAASTFGSWDRFRLEQIITNLVSNAVKYGNRKPVTVRIEGTATAARLSVEDHGIGISRENLDRIFNYFERAVPASQYCGVGLGLWIVKQIVEAHGGSISVRSSPNVGSVFTVELPLKPALPAVNPKQMTKQTA